MKKLLVILITSFLLSNNSHSFEKYKPLSELDLRIRYPIELLYEDNKNIFINNCEFFNTEITSAISDYDFLEIINQKRKEFSINCRDIVYEIYDIKNKLVKDDFDLTLDVCNGKIYAFDITFHLSYKEGLLGSRPGFGENPNILKEWVAEYYRHSNEDPEIYTNKNSPYKDINGNLFDSYTDVRSWKHQISDRKNKSKYLIYISSAIYRNDDLGPTMNRVSFSIFENTIRRLKDCGY
tara:strand:- start:53 stop:763 length:711 start_codon:yes stop_codon:yes gene_type:complete